MGRITKEELKLFGNREAVEENRIYKKFEQSPEHHKDYDRLMYFEFDEKTQVGELLSQRELRLFERQRQHQKERMSRLMKSIMPRADHFFLDLGCGVGPLGYQIARSGARVVGLDNNREALQIGSALLSEYSLLTSVSFVCQDAGLLPFRSAIFDRVVCADVMEHLTDEEKRVSLQEIYRVLRPDGKVFLHTPNQRRVQLGLLKRRGLALLRWENPVRIMHHYAEGGGHIGLTTPRRLMGLVTASGFSCRCMRYPGDIPIFKSLSTKLNDLLSAKMPGLRDWTSAHFIVIGRKGHG